MKCRFGTGAHEPPPGTTAVRASANLRLCNGRKAAAAGRRRSDGRACRNVPADCPGLALRFSSVNQTVKSALIDSVADTDGFFAASSALDAAAAEAPDDYRPYANRSRLRSGRGEQPTTRPD